MTFNRDAYFDSVRSSLFAPGMDQDQVDGQEVILSTWEQMKSMTDIRWLAYMLATTYHETAQTMQPIEEYGQGEGHEYGEIDPETGQGYWGRGFVQLTWRENYARATQKLGLKDENDIEWHAEQALDMEIATGVLFLGMTEGWFTGRKLGDYFSSSKDDPINARQIINGNDKDTMIAGYHDDFLSALQDAERTVIEPDLPTITVTIESDQPVRVRLIVSDGVEMI